MSDEDCKDSWLRHAFCICLRDCGKLWNTCQTVWTVAYPRFKPVSFIHTNDFCFVWLFGPFPGHELPCFLPPITAFYCRRAPDFDNEHCGKFYVHVTMHHNKFLIIKPTIYTNFSNLFLEWNSTCFGQFLCPSSGVFHCTHSNGICHTGLLTACEQDQDGTSWSCSQAVWHKPLLCVEWKTPDDGQRNCPKHVEFHSKNKFEKLVHLVGCIIRNVANICDSAWYITPQLHWTLAFVATVYIL